jgi:hypothetical protein
MFYYKDSVSDDPRVISGKYRIMNDLCVRRLLLKCVDCVKWARVIGVYRHFQQCYSTAIS